jgi:hypothetical protein
MSDGKIVYTLKGGAGYDAPWIVISGDTVDEATDNLKAATLAFGEVTAAAALFSGAQVAAPLTVPTQTAAPTTVAATAAPQGRFCTHGPRTRRAGTSARGAWVGWFCPLAKGHPDQCSAEFE